MAKSKIESDHGLNVRMFLTGLALVILYVIIFSVLLSVGVALGFVIVIAAGCCSASTTSRTRSRCSRCTRTR